MALAWAPPCSLCQCWRKICTQPPFFGFRTLQGSHVPLPFPRIPYELNSRLKISARPARVNEVSASPNLHAFLGPPKKQKSFKLSLPCAVPTRTLHTPKPIVPTRTLSNQALSIPLPRSFLKQPRDPILRRHFGPIRPQKRTLEKLSHIH